MIINFLRHETAKLIISTTDFPVNIRVLSALLFFIALIGSTARAQLLVPFLQSSNFVFNGGVLSTNVSFQQWDPAVRGGPLTNVSFTISNAAVSGAFYVLNGQSTNITLSNPRTQQIFSFAGGGAPASIFNSTQSLTNVLYAMTPAVPGPGGVLEPAEDGFVILNSPQPISLNSFTTNFTDPGFLSYFTGTGTVSLTIISSFNLSGIGSIANLDKSGLTTAGMVELEMVPEPSTYALLGLSALSLGYFAWRRRRA